ncbi:hypothetical protein HDU88_002376 [Geranomyces variabilis]|nr:hypothetical protein HDU88_002376 [Geranomyces variabilis]
MAAAHHCTHVRNRPLLLRSLLAAIVVIFANVRLANAHDHHAALTDAAGDITAGTAAIDSILYIHMALQALAWGFLFPLGAVLGLSKSRLHVPCQILATVLTAGGWILGHAHKGRQFPVTAHGLFAYFVAWLLAAQVVIGVYLKLHINEGTVFRRALVCIHGLVGRLWPIVSWVQMMLGVIAVLGFCQASQEAKGQCLTHLSAGSALVFYGLYCCLVLRIGTLGLAGSAKRSPEAVDSCIIVIAGIVTITAAAIAATTPPLTTLMTMGLAWLAAGTLSLFLCWNGKRSVFPALILVFTGAAVLSTAQTSEAAAAIFYVAIGATLICAGLARITDITLLVFYRDNIPFKHITPFLLTLSGIMLLSLTNEQLGLLARTQVTHSTFMLLQLAVASGVYLWLNILLAAYDAAAAAAKAKTKMDAKENDAAQLLPGSQIDERSGAYKTVYVLYISTHTYYLPTMAATVNYDRVKTYRISDFTGIDKLRLQEGSVSAPKRGQVAVRIHAVSLNYRDLITIKGSYPGPKDTSNGGLIPCSDGAGEVVEVGEGVTEFKVGDRVATNFHDNWESGPVPATVGSRALGGALQGTLTQLGVFEERGLVHVPDSLSYEEAATLTCAPLTAYTALRDTPHPIGPESIVLVQGTGGVSVFAAQLALAAGARVIATSSSDQKLQTYAKLGVKQPDLINYKTTPDWPTEVRKRAPDGVDHVVEVSGQLAQSVKCTKKGGTITIIGFVGEAQSISAADILFGAVNLRGVLIGSRHSFKQLLLAVDHNSIKPVIDKVFGFEEVPEAFKYLESQKHVGKIVIKVTGK